jgi:hypothetical protein
VQALGAEQDTPLSVLEPPVLGVACTVQLLPFQRSASSE